MDDMKKVWINDLNLDFCWKRICLWVRNWKNVNSLNEDNWFIEEKRRVIERKRLINEKAHWSNLSNNY